MSTAPWQRGPWRTDICHRCKKLGHWRKNCPERKRRQFVYKSPYYDYITSNCCIANAIPIPNYTIYHRCTNLCTPECHNIVSSTVFDVNTYVKYSLLDGWMNLELYKTMTWHDVMEFPFLGRGDAGGRTFAPSPSSSSGARDTYGMPYLVWISCGDARGRTFLPRGHTFC